jgi:hypothetical protein
MNRLRAERRPSLVVVSQHDYIPLAALRAIVYDRAGSHSHIESAKLRTNLESHLKNREDLAYDNSERKGSTTG